MDLGRYATKIQAATRRLQAKKKDRQASWTLAIAEASALDPLQVLKRGASEIRQRHSLVVLLSPTESTLTEGALTDPQLLIIFFNAVLTELCIAAFWSGTSDKTTCDVSATDLGNITLAEDLRNSTGRRLAARTGRSSVAGSDECAAGNIKLVTLLIMGCTESIFLVLTVLICRFVFNIGNKLISTPKKRRWRRSMGWIANLGIWASLSWITLAYGQCLGETTSQRVLTSFASGVAIGWLFMEPLFIALIVCLPCLCKNSFMEWLNDRLNDLGIDLSLVVSL